MHGLVLLLLPLPQRGQHRLIWKHFCNKALLRVQAADTHITFSTVWM
jgi:hypothetical protein